MVSPGWRGPLVAQGGACCRRVASLDQVAYAVLRRAAARHLSQALCPAQLVSTLSIDSTPGTFRSTACGCRGEKALAVVQQLLDGSSAAEAGLQDIRLFSFRAIPSSKRLDIRLDKLTGAGRPRCGPRCGQPTPV